MTKHEHEGTFVMALVAFVLGYLALILMAATQSPSDRTDIRRLETQVAEMRDPRPEAQ